MTAQQTPKLVAALVEHQECFVTLTTEEAQGVIKDPKGSIAKFVAAIKNQAQAAVETIRSMIIDSSKGFKVLLAECGNNWVNGDITEKLFPVTAEDDGEWEYDLWDPKGSVSSGDAIERMKGDDKDNPWSPARTAHLLVFGAKNPDAQRSNPIAALGAVAKVDGDRYVLCLCRGSSKRDLNLWWLDDGWFADYRFLRVRKVVKKS